ncbi:radical SAM protein [uncultured Desulfobacter sp.]|uniref:radical SAM/SPASM domain-containing protein n=1 Tax=uncultured Desulfobacter sp. TaxID=240139 RepID=UPI0029F57E6A|nr:radical SAM protein [uncultured Desulfobacter sp.]
MRWPLLLDLELTNACNLNCLQCWRHDMHRNITQLDLKIVRKIFRDASRSVRGIRFIGHGENLLHPDFFILALEAKKLGFLVHLTTNGLLLTPKRIRQLLELELDSIVFSFQGTDKEGYEEMRRNKGYDRLCNIIQELVQQRGKSPLPYVVVNTTTLDETDEQIEAFRQRWIPIVDEVGHWFTTLERLEHLEHVQNLLPRQRIRQAMVGRVRCIEIHTKLSINSDGQACLCCNDYNGELAVGSVYEQGIEQLWNSERAQALRKMIDKDYRSVPFCQKCSNKFNRMDHGND